jgi:hypothetical protein
MDLAAFARGYRATTVLIYVGLHPVAALAQSPQNFQLSA